MSHLRLVCLGTPTVEHGPQAVKFATRKVLALLIYIAVEGGMTAREKIMALLWPDSDNTHARTALRTTLAHLRAALNEAEAPHLLVTRDSLGLNPDSALDFDLRVCEAAFRAARDLHERPARELLTQLQQAIALVHGDFLEGFSLSDAPDFDDWASTQREAWHRRLAVIFDRLTQLQFEGGVLAQGSENAARWIAHDPLNETAYRRLMQFHLANGDRAAARRAYEACRIVLARELNAEPSSETEALLQRLNAEAASMSEDPSSFMPRTSSVALEAPLVGRLGEHMALVAAYRAARRAQPQLVVVAGEPGIGKTRLIRAFLDWARAQGGDVLQGRAFELGGRVPYQALVDALRGRLSRQPNAREGLSAAWLAELTRLLPELSLEAEATRTVGAAGDEAEARTRLFEAVAQLGEALASRAPLVLFVDDLQWVDASSLDLLHYALRRWGESHLRVMCVCAVRAEDMDAALQGWLAELGRHVALTHLRLDLLTRTDTQEMVDALVKQAADAGRLAEGDGAARGDLAARLFAETAGHPLFIMETFKSLLEQNAAAGGAPLPDNVRNVIVARLNRLSPAARELLSAAAVLHPRLDFESLCLVAGENERDALNALDELLKRGLLRETIGSGEAPVRPCIFTHDKIREIAYFAVSETRRRVYHRRAGETLECAHAEALDEVAALVAHHFDLCADPRALSYYRLAGDAAARVYANREAAAHYARALELARQAPDSSLAHKTEDSQSIAALIRDMFLRRGRVLELAGQYDAALQNYIAMQETARVRADGEMELTALMALATVHSIPSVNFDIAQARALSAQALAIARALGNRAAEARILWNLMQHTRITGDVPQAVVYGEQSLTIARESGLREQVAFTLNDLSPMYMFVAQSERGWAGLQEARALWQEFNNLPMLCDNLGHSVYYLMLSGDLRQAIATANEAFALGERLGNVWGQAYSLTFAGQCYKQLGLVDKAIETMQTAIRLGEQAGFIFPLVLTRADLARLYGEMGDTARGLELARLALAQTELFPIARLYAMGTLAQLQLMSGEYSAAQATLRAGQQHADASSVPPMFSYPFHYADALAALAEQDYPRAMHGAERIAMVLRQFKMQVALPEVQHLRAQALHARGCAGEAMRQWQHASADAEEMEALWSLWPILLGMSEVRMQDADAEFAHQWHVHARAIITSITTHMSSPSLRESFLALPQVRRVVQSTTF